MENQVAVNMLKAKLECLTRSVSGTDEDCNRHLCSSCPLNYEQGNMAEQKECLRLAIFALERNMKLAELFNFERS